MSVQDSIPEEKMIALAHEFVEMGVKAVTFSGGGEPLLYKPLSKVIRILSAGGVRTAALTNGANLKGDMADAFAEHGTWVRISMDAWDEESYAKIRGAKPGDFFRLMENICDFTARNTQCVLGVSFIVTHENYDHIAEIATMLKGAGVNHMKVSGAITSNDAAGNNRYHATIKEAVAEQIARVSELVDASFTVLNHYHDLEERFQKDYHSCPYLQFLPVIGADQYVYTCHDKAYTELGRMGSIANQSFADYWFSEENALFLRTFDPSVKCQHHCVQHSRNLAVHEYLDLDDEHSYFV